MERSWGCPFPGGAKARLVEGSCPQQGLEPGGLRGPFQPKLLHSLNRARKLQHLSHLSTREEDAAPFAWQQTVTQTKRGGKRRSRADRCSLTHANPPEPSLFQHSRDEGMTRALAWIAPTPPGDRSRPQRLPGPTSPAAAGGGFVPRCRRQHRGCTEEGSEPAQGTPRSERTRAARGNSSKGQDVTRGAGSAPGAPGATASASTAGSAPACVG